MTLSLPILLSFLTTFVLFSVWEIAFVLWLAPRPSKMWPIVRALLLALVQGLLLIGLYAMLRTFENRALASALWVGGIIGLAMALLGWLHEGLSKEERTGRLVLRSLVTVILSIGSAALAFLFYR